ncbi:tetratricopeptide repeat protein [soil metagenome]
MQAGDIAEAARLAPSKTEGSMGAQRLGRLARATEALAKGDGASARLLLADDMVGPPHGTAASLMAPWAAAMAGNTNPDATPPRAADTPAAALLARYSQAVLLEKARKYKESEAAYKSLFETAPSVGMFGLGYGAFLERRGRRGEAVGLYDAVLKQNPESPAIIAAHDRAKAKGKAPVLPTDVQGAAQSLIALAGNLAGRQPENTFVYLRLAMRLDSTRNDGWVMMGESLDMAGDREGARAAYLRVGPGVPEYIAARLRLAVSYEADKDLDKALQVARETAQNAPAEAEAQILFANLLTSVKDYKGSAKVLDAVITSQGDKAGWRLFYIRAIALERADRWSDAEKDLQKALVLAPNQPEVLNYLGYSWADRGVRLPEALTMLQRAVRSNPSSGAMIDSLGWVYYRMGDLPSAVANLERAVVLDPSDPDVNNHLGDVYWRVDRKIEAQYQWQRVLTLDPDAKLKAEVEAKLKSGLTPVVVARSGGV